MNKIEIVTTLDVILWRKSLNKDLTKKQVRENVINFFGNDNLTTNHKTIENAIQNIETMEKGFKRKLKLLIASEEYEKYKEIPPKDNTRRCKPLVPPQSFESPHVYRKDSILNKFKCKDCHQEFTPEENAIKHMNDDKLRTNAWLEKLDDKMSSHLFENIVFVVKQCDVDGSEVQGEVHTRAGSILRIGSGSGLGVHDIPIRVQKQGLVPPLVCTMLVKLL